jgi:hypothetical protein
MTIKLKIEDALYPLPRYYKVLFISEHCNKWLVVNNNMWLCLDKDSRSCSLPISENMRTILKDSPAIKYPND